MDGLPVFNLTKNFTVVLPFDFYLFVTIIAVPYTMNIQQLMNSDYYLRHDNFESSIRCMLFYFARVFLKTIVNLVINQLI